MARGQNNRQPLNFKSTNTGGLPSVIPSVVPPGVQKGLLCLSPPPPPTISPSRDLLPENGQFRDFNYIHRYSARPFKQEHRACESHAPLLKFISVSKPLGETYSVVSAAKGDTRTCYDTEEMVWLIQRAYNLLDGVKHSNCADLLV